MEQSYIIGGSVGGTIGLVIFYYCVKFCRIIIGGSCIDSRNRIHVEIGDEKSNYHIQADTVIHVQLGNKALIAKKEKEEKEQEEKEKAEKVGHNTGHVKEGEENPKGV